MLLFLSHICFVLDLEVIVPLGNELLNSFLLPFVLFLLLLQFLGKKDILHPQQFGLLLGLLLVLCEPDPNIEVLLGQTIVLLLQVSMSGHEILVLFGARLLPLFISLLQSFQLSFESFRLFDQVRHLKLMYFLEVDEFQLVGRLKVRRYRGSLCSFLLFERTFVIG